MREMMANCKPPALLAKRKDAKTGSDFFVAPGHINAE